MTYLGVAVDTWSDNVCLWIWWLHLLFTILSYI